MANAILGLRAETSIHAGTGQNVGAVDLPIQREAHTSWPCVFGSAMKGALRNHAETRGGMDKAIIPLVFGPESANASDHAGALAVTDARILLLPVRSLTGHFKLVTCPAVLSRLTRDLQMIGAEVGFSAQSDPVAGTVATPTGRDPIFLEEFQFTQTPRDLSDVITALVGFGIEKESVEKQLVIMRNDDFADFCRMATAVTPHIAIDNARKTVRSGALWYEETLPSDTLLYVMLLANAARNGGASPSLSDIEVLGKATGMFTSGDKPNPYLQIGGNETVGMGWCKVMRAQL
ncbi:MAG: type III-B CRISPR module RAMP protein Cmr4 [Gammaproteobacteria bacterium]